MLCFVALPDSDAINVATSKMPCCCVPKNYVTLKHENQVHGTSQEKLMLFVEVVFAKNAQFAFVGFRYLTSNPIQRVLLWSQTQLFLTPFGQLAFPALPPGLALFFERLALENMF